MASSTRSPRQFGTQKLMLFFLLASAIGGYNALKASETVRAYLEKDALQYNYLLLQGKAQKAQSLLRGALGVELSAEVITQTEGDEDCMKYEIESQYFRQGNKKGILPYYYFLPQGNVEICIQKLNSKGLKSLKNRMQSMTGPRDLAPLYQHPSKDKMGTKDVTKAKQQYSEVKIDGKSYSLIKYAFTTDTEPFEKAKTRFNRSLWVGIGVPSFGLIVSNLMPVKVHLKNKKKEKANKKEIKKKKAVKEVKKYPEGFTLE